jgi:hypothetical protein
VSRTHRWTVASRGVTLAVCVRVAHLGGFTLWPGSHASMWCASDEEINWVENDEFGPRMDKIRAETQPLIFTGDIGDTVFVSTQLRGHELMHEHSTIYVDSCKRLRYKATALPHSALLCCPCALGWLDWNIRVYD